MTKMYPILDNIVGRDWEGDWLRIANMSNYGITNINIFLDEEGDWNINLISTSLEEFEECFQYIESISIIDWEEVE
ncbi:hypothetical protein [Listeria phage LP-KV022]|uniref:Uncharacterized protein n=2 Tax=Homburgvirus LP110 TaxID=1921128 RepID=A0A5A4K5G8_9CAUD|nr:hypothetical protein LP110_055 [Listeria phage LP-110]AGI11558.1 hypothetical protein LP110_055 [Listeria phage LP-110]AWY07748.1 hypothetical protein [Listeria phage LP-KV022]